MAIFSKYSRIITHWIYGNGKNKKLQKLNHDIMKSKINSSTLKSRISGKENFSLLKETNEKHNIEKKHYGKKKKAQYHIKHTDGKNQELHFFWGLSTPVLNKSLVLTLEEPRSLKDH